MIEEIINEIIEEPLEFGMSAVQLSMVSDLTSHVSKLDQPLQSISDNLNAIKKQGREQGREYQKQQEILKLRESIFNFKTHMEEVYQTDKFTTENKYLQFRGVGRASAVQVLNPEYFETFNDKEYVVSIKKYLIETKDELFDNLDNDKKTIIKTIENKEKQLEEMVNLSISIHKPNLPSKPLLGKLKHTRKPIKPIGYYTEIARKDLTSDQGIVYGQVFFYLGITILSSILLVKVSPFLLVIVVVVVVVKAILLGGRYIHKISQQNEIREEIDKYTDSLSKYLKDEEYNRKIFKKYKDKLKYYNDNQKNILQNYQNKLKRYENYQNDIKILKQEIISLYKIFW